MNKLLLIKLGGGVITDKHKRYGLRREVLERLVKEIAGGYTELKDTQLIIGNGAGSFAHYSASRYRTAEGFVDGESRVGLGWVRYDAVRLNQIVFEQLLLSGLPVYSYSPSSLMSVEGGETSRVFGESVRNGLAQGMIPLVYGDAMVDRARGSAIYSTERVFDELVKLLNGEYEIRVIHINNEEGVLVDGQVVPEITQDNFGKIKGELGKSSGVDVTGGMLHKVEACLAIAKLGVESLIVNGVVKGRVREAIRGGQVVGTRIC